jgi:hypothetical protein
MRISGKIMAFANGQSRHNFLPAFASICFLACALLPHSAIAQGDISVQGRTILRDGQPWIAKGVTFVGRVAPAAATRAGHELAQARNQFGAQELQSAKQFGADLIRFQVSQGGSDPQSSIYSQEYVSEVEAAVKMARDQGLSVIVSLQAETPSGLDERGMPNKKAQRAWQSLAPLFATDRGVMLELFNEPSPKGPDAVQPHNWDNWKAAMQPIVDELRRAGSKNVILADGLYWAQMLDGAPQLEDPMSEIVYAVHPYYSPRLRGKLDWDNMFGNFSQRHPVMVTEWNALSFRNDCDSGMPNFAADMVSYLKERNIGLVAWAYDYPRALFTNFNGPLTSYVGFQCGPETDFGAGELIARSFK